jgi:foldase protein PrsA
MSEGNPLAPENPKLTPRTPTEATAMAGRRRTIQIAAASAGALILAGIIFQLGRAQSTNAAERAADAGARPAGNVELAAKVTRNGRSIQIPLDNVARECLLRIGNDVLDSMLNRAVIQLACEEQGVTVTHAEVEQEITRIAQQFKIPVENWIAMLQQERNISPEQYSRDIIWPMLALKKLAGSGVDITKEDLHKAFTRHYGPRVKCRMIMCDNLRRADDVWQQAKLKPDDFERLARDHSIDPNSRSLGGSIPPIARYSGNDDIETAAFKLREGEISHIVNIGFNRYVILKSEGLTKQLVTDPKDVSVELHRDLVEQKVEDAIAKLFDGLKRSTRIDNYWNQTTTGDMDQVSGTATRRRGIRQASEVRPQAAGKAAPRTPGSGTARPTGRSTLSLPAPTSPTR